HAQIFLRQYFESFPEATSCRIIGQHFSHSLNSLCSGPRVASLHPWRLCSRSRVPMHENTDIASRRYMAEETLTFRDVARAPVVELHAAFAQPRHGLSQ